MQLNNISLRREIDAQRWTITALASEIGESRTHLSNVANGNRPASPGLIFRLAEALNMNPYGLLGPESPRAAVIEMATELGITADELAILGSNRHVVT